MTYWPEGQRWADRRGYPWSTIPQFMFWPPPPADLKCDEWNGLHNQWQQGRCAICGGPGGTVDDHDHATGKLRGGLCGSCNVLEGMRQGDVFGRWRAGMNPCAMFGWDIPYRPFG